MSKEVKIGAIVLVALVAAWFGLTYLKGSNLFKTNVFYYTVYEKVEGLSVSSPVHYNGLKIGIVRKIALSEDSIGQMRVDFSIENENLKIPSNSVASFKSDFLGGSTIDLIPGDSDVMAENGSMLDPSINEGITGEIRDQFLPLKQKTEELVGEVDQIIASLNAIFADESTQKLPKAFESLQRSLMTLENTSSRVDGMIAENREKFGSVMSNVKEITSTFKENSGDLENVIKNFSSISDSLAAVEFAVIVSELTETLAEVAEITEKINSGQGSLGQLVNSDSLVVELQQSNQELQYLLNDLYTHPKKYVGFSIIGRKDRNGFSNKEEDRIKEIIKEN